MYMYVYIHVHYSSQPRMARIYFTAGTLIAGTFQYTYVCLYVYCSSQLRTAHIHFTAFQVYIYVYIYAYCSPHNRIWCISALLLWRSFSFPEHVLFSLSRNFPPIFYSTKFVTVAHSLYPSNVASFPFQCRFKGRVERRGGGLGSSTIFKKFTEPYAPS